MTTIRHIRPAWFKNAIIYQILIDRFAGAHKKENKPDFLGGNIKGIIKRLDYLADLGVNTIWLSPFCSTHEYHGYHITDYTKVDPHFGTSDDLHMLIEGAHKKSMRVITDYVPNHCSVHHPFFKEAVRSRESKYNKWFYFKKWPEDYLSFLDVRELAKLNLDNPETSDYFIDIAKYWLEYGLDGYRIDHVIGPSHTFWKKFRSEIKTCYPDCVLIGEAWGEGISSKFFETINFKRKLIRSLLGVSQDGIQKEYYGELDGILDFRLNDIITDAVSRGKGFASGNTFNRDVRKHFSKYPDDYYLVSFLDNHDMNRFLFCCNGDYDILLEALEFLLETSKPLIIYYGTEFGMCNTEPVTVNLPYSDLKVREPVDWKSQDRHLNDRVKELIHKHAKKVF